jgi:hypothetical protein
MSLQKKRRLMLMTTTEPKETKVMPAQTRWRKPEQAEQPWRLMRSLARW